MRNELEYMPLAADTPRSWEDRFNEMRQQHRHVENVVNHLNEMLDDKNELIKEQRKHISYLMKTVADLRASEAKTCQCVDSGKNVAPGDDTGPQADPLCESEVGHE